jgi:hypothetical protein
MSDPTGKRALFEAAGRPITMSGVNGTSGKAALFSNPHSSTPTPGTVLVECSACLARTRISLTDLARRMLTGSAWMPLLRPAYPHWLRCPACRRRSWCRIGWND